MTQAATIKKPSLNKAELLDFATQEAPQAIKTKSVRGRVGSGSKSAQKAIKTDSKRVFFAPDGDKRLTINLDQDLHKALKLKAVELETTVGDILEDLVRQYLGK